MKASPLFPKPCFPHAHSVSNLANKMNRREEARRTKADVNWAEILLIPQPENTPSKFTTKQVSSHPVPSYSHYYTLKNSPLSRGTFVLFMFVAQQRASSSQFSRDALIFILRTKNIPRKNELDYRKIGRNGMQSNSRVFLGVKVGKNSFHIFLQWLSQNEKKRVNWKWTRVPQKAV